MTVAANRLWNWRTIEQIEKWRPEVHADLDNLIANLASLEEKLTSFHDEAKHQTSEFNIAVGHVAAAWRAAGYAKDAIA